MSEPRRLPPSRCVYACLLLITASTLGCGAPRQCGPASPPPAPTASAAADPVDLAARLQRERDEALHRALDAQRALDDARGQCDLTRHELDSLRELEAFEDIVWYRLGQADISAATLREAVSAAPAQRRKAMGAALEAADAAVAAIERTLRRVHSVSDVEWPRYKHDLESALDGLDRSLRDAR